MSVNWKMDETALGRETFAEDFDDYGRGEDHKVSIGDEVEATDKYGRPHAGVVVGIIRDINREPVCYKVWNEELDDFDFIQASDNILCEPCGSSQWSLERIGYVQHGNDADRCWFYLNKRTGDVIYW